MTSYMCSRVGELTDHIFNVYYPALHRETREVIVVWTLMSHGICIVELWCWLRWSNRLFDIESVGVGVCDECVGLLVR